MDNSFSGHKEDWVRVKGLLEQGVHEKTFPCAVIKVLKDSKVVFDFATGFSSLLPLRRKITMDTIFDIASLTKVIVATSAVMLLVQEKKLKLDESISAYMSDIYSEDKKYISIRQLLSHSAGFNAWKPIFKEIQDEETRTGVKIFVTQNARHFFLKMHAISF